MRSKTINVNHVPRWSLQPACNVVIHDIGIEITKEIFGALSQDPADPLSRVSIANSSFSLDPFRGCPARCAYCTVAGSARDIEIEPSINGNTTKIRLPAKPERLFTGKLLAKALMEHPAFIKNKSIVSIGTGSTESFLPDVEDETWNIMSFFLEAGYKNPFWIVTKMSIPDISTSKWYNRFSLLHKNGIEVVISVTHSGAPTWIEPYQGDRFRNIGLMKNAGIRVSHHLRPIIQGINDTDYCMRKALDDAIDIVEVICIGGLRRDMGVDISWRYVYNLDPSYLPSSHNNRQKEIPNGYIEKVQEYLNKKGVGHIPVVTRSSEAISWLLGIPEYNLYRYRPNDNNCFLSIPSNIQRSIQSKFGKPLVNIIRQIAQDRGLDDICPIVRKDEIILNRDLCFQEHRVLIHAISHANILP